MPLLVFGVAAVLIATGQFTSFTYIRPYLETAAGFSPGWAAPLLFAYGAGSRAFWGWATITKTAAAPAQQ